MAISVHPGTASTDGVAEIVRSMPYVGGWFSALLYKYFVLTPLDGARTPLFAATHPDVKTKRDVFAGAYVTPFGRITLTTPAGLDKEVARNLWITSEEIAEELLGSGSE